MIDQTISFMWHRTKELYTENLQLKMDAESIAADERAKIVDWLRSQVSCGCGRSDCYTDRFPLNHAKAIEAGKHLK